MNGSNNDKIYYDYMKAVVNEDKMSEYMDGYECFGWQPDDNMEAERSMGKISLHFKRNRRILNKTELTRLQRHYEACMNEIRTLENSVADYANIASIVIGLIGCAFMAGSVFAVTATPPIVWLCAVLAVPGFILWVAAYPVFKYVRNRRAGRVAVLIENKYEEAYGVCDKARKLL